MTNPLVSIVTPTTGTKYLKQAIDSVQESTYKNIQHLVVVDGNHPNAKVILDQYSNIDKIFLPYATGTEQYNGHRIYGGCTYFIRGEYVIFLDEDNWFDPNHVESLINSLENNLWSFALRKIVSPEGQYICNDDCESLGNWISVINDYFVDVNCYMLHKSLALQFSPGWYRRARHPQDQPEVDRLLSMYLRQNDLKSNCTGEYSVNYRAGNRADSVKSQFFLNGNEFMKQKYNGNFPWRKF